MSEQFVERPHKNEKKNAIQYVQMLLQQAREENRNEDIEKLEELVRLLHTKKYGLVWEEHAELVEEEMKTKIPVFVEDKGRKIIGNPASDDYNFLLEGDNLHSLHLLEKTHTGKIDVIYIDPPYNTKNEGFIYNDKIVNSEDGYRHSKWLSFMYKRLVISKELLNENGIIFISIDDNELFQLKNLCDDIFGEENFVNNITVKSSEASGVKMSHVSKRLVKMTENVLLYKNRYLKLQPIKISKQKWDNEYNKVLLNFTKKDKEYIDYIIENYENFSEEVYEKHVINIDKILSNCKVDSVSKISKSEGIDKRGLNDWKYKNSYRIFRTAASSSVYKLVEKKKKYNKNLFFSIISSRDKKLYLAKTDYKETSKSPRVQILFAEDYLEEYVGNLWTDISTTGLEIEGGISFKNGKKPLDLINRILKMYPSDSYTVLDFFAGSGTTGHAITQLNKEDGGNRKYILCTNNENQIAEEVTYKRLSNIQEELPHNLKYFKTDFVDKTKFPDFSLEFELLNYITPLVELEFGIDISNPSVEIILTEEHLERLLGEEQLKQGATLFIHPDVFIDTKEQEAISRLNITLQEIPDYFFGKELWSND